MVRNAAKFGDCLMYRITRDRLLMHPQAGVWSKPDYRPLDSLTSTFNGNERFTGWGRWGKGLGGSKWRVALFCGSNGLVYRKMNQSLVTAP